MLVFGRPLRSQAPSQTGRFVTVVGAMVMALGSSATAEARTHRSAEAETAIGSVSLQSLPAEAQTTYRLIRAGGPFPYPKDGIVFSNRERSLPRHPRGFYHEYTVRTPGARDRGARRIVCGGPPASVCYYTSDHYATFAQIAN